MINLRLRQIPTLLMMLFLAACGAFADKHESIGGTGMLVVDTNPEQIKNKLNVYDSMARATKYNIDAEGRSLYRKAKSDTNKSEDYFDGGVGKLQQVAKALDFAITYATINLSSNNIFADNYVYETAARDLALEAIVTHNKAWFAKKNERALKKWEAQEQKIINLIDEKEKRNGSLVNEEYDYRKNQVVALMRLQEIKDGLVAEVSEYADLVKSGPLSPVLEGRKFYALENFDNDYSVVLFQETAYRNRKEFALLKEVENSLSFSQLRRNISNRYSPVSRLDVNGKTIEFDVYEDELYQKAKTVADNLVSAVNKYRKAKLPASEYLRVSAFEDLGVAVLTQVELYYQLVMQADVKYEEAIKAEANIRKEIARLEKIRRITNDDKLALFNAKITLLKLERQKAKISAERAKFLRALYFAGGLSPFKTDLLRQSDRSVAEALKKSFNADLSTMLAGVNAPIKEVSLIEGKTGWAQKPNWLEDVVASNGEILSPSFDASKKTMQLGAYLSKRNAEDDWARLKNKYSELRGYDPDFEVATVSGKEWFRLQIKAGAKELFNICNVMKNKGDDCLLK